MLLHLPDGYKPEQVRDALAEKIKTLPTSLRLSLTWDQGVEMRDWKQVRMATDMAIFFCDPHAPWQRGTNENTVSIEDGSVGLLSQAGAEHRCLRWILAVDRRLCGTRGQGGQEPAAPGSACRRRDQIHWPQATFTERR